MSPTTSSITVFRYNLVIWLWDLLFTEILSILALSLLPSGSEQHEVLPVGSISEGMLQARH